jgi:2-aminomuconate deaminase
MATIQKFQDLEIWQLARELEKEIFIISKEGQLAKDFSLKDQMNRSTGSLMDNIAEGFGRGGRNEFIQFLSIAKASLTELESQVIRCYDRKYILKEQLEKINAETLLIGNKIGALMKHLNAADIKGQKFLNRTTIKQNNNQTSNSINNQTGNTKLQTPNNLINTPNAATPLGAYPHARRVGNLLFLSGIGSRSAKDNSIPGLELDEHGNIVKYDIAAETHQVMANVKAVLEASRSSWDKIVDVTVFLTNMKKDFPVYNKIYAEYFSEVQACRTTVEVKSLPTPIAIELKVIATID